MNEKSLSIVATGKMSNLVNMWAFIWNENKLLSRVFILGKADDQHYIVQAINALTGSPNVCKIVELKDMVNWIFYPNINIAEDCYKDYLKHNLNRYDFDLGKKIKKEVVL